MKKKLLLFACIMLQTTYIFSGVFAQLAEDYYVKGIEAYKSNNLEDAIDSFEKCLFYNEQDGRELPYRSANAAQWKAYTYHRLGNDSLAAKIHPYYKVKPYDDIISLTADSLANIAMIEAGNNNNDVSVSLYIKASKKYAEIGDTLSMASCLGDMARIYLSEEKYEVAKPLLEQALALTKDVLSDSDVVYAFYLNDMALLYYKTEYYSTALQIWQKVLISIEQASGSHSEEYTIVLNHIAMTYCALNEYEKAEPVYLRLLELMSKLPSENNIEYVLCIKDFANLYFQMNRYSEAEAKFLEAINLMNNLQDRNESEYISLIASLASLYDKTNRYTEAETKFIEAINLMSSLQDRDESEYISLIVALASLYDKTNRYTEAETKFIEAINLMSNLQDRDELEYILLIENLAIQYYKMDRYPEAELRFLEAFVLIKNNGLQNIEFQEKIADELATAYISTEKYSHAEQLLKEILESRRQRLGESHPDYIHSLKQLSNFYGIISDNSKAIPLLTAALKILKNTAGEMSDEYLFTKLELATVYHNKGDFENATKLYFSAWQNISTKASSMSDLERKEKYHKLETYLHLFNVVKFTLDLYDFFKSNIQFMTLKGEAEKFISIAESMLQEFIVTDDKLINDYTKIQGSLLLSEIYIKTGKYNKAEDLLKKNYKFTDDIYHGLQYTCLSLLCELYANKPDIHETKPYLEKLYYLCKNHINLNFEFMSELQRGQFTNQYYDLFNGFIPFFCYYDYSHCDSIACFAYDNELFKKGLLLNASNEVKRSIFESGDSSLIKKWEMLQYTKEKIVRLQSQPFDKQAGLKDLENKAEQLDKELTKASTAYRDRNKSLNITWSDVQNKLKDNDAAVEFVSFQDSTDITYYALLLRKGYKYPKLIPLCSEGEVFKSFDPADEKRSAYTYSDTNNLYDKLWGKLATYIEDGTNVYYSPCGMLHLVNLEAIPVDQNTYLGDKYNLIRLSSTREIVMDGKQTTDKTAVLYGGIKYNMNANDMAMESKRYASEEYILATRSIEYDSDSLYRGGIRKLPGTKVEAEQIKKMLSPKFTKVTTFYADSANEESFKALSGKKYNILHIGTHGFFWPIETASRQELFKSRMYGLDSDETARYNPLADPMQRSGLLFAGASLAISGKADSLAQNVEDGILTAKEIANIDLKEADLVVLSACETGKGEISGEGVFGLQRGFKQAGAKTIIMSLWKVNDVATKDFMLSFYKHLTNGDSKREAFKAAILDTRKGYPEPDCWASFVMMD